MNDQHPLVMEHEEGKITEKRAWQPPVIEELDFSGTEAAYIFGGFSDAGIYTF